jgi:hypothetical protein
MLYVYNGCLTAGARFPMDRHTYHPGLDPLHKIHAADWFDPIAVAKDGYYEIGAVKNWPPLTR